MTTDEARQERWDRMREYLHLTQGAGGPDLRSLATYAGITPEELYLRLSAKETPDARR